MNMKTLTTGMVFLFFASLVNADEVIVPASLAASKAGEKATIELRVESSKLLDRDEPICFLNSTKNHFSKDTFTVVFFSKALKRFQDAEIPNPAEHFYHKTIQVTGEVGLRQGKPQIIVEYVGQIKIIEKAEK